MPKMHPLEESDEGLPVTPPRPSRRWSLPLSFLGLLLLIGAQYHLFDGWVSQDSRPASWDQSIHLEIAHDYATFLKQGDHDAIVRLAPKPGMPPFPPLYELSLAPVVSRPDAESASLRVNFVWMVFLLVAVWGLGILYAGDWEALAAVILVACVPETQSLLRNQLSDLPLAAWIAGAYFAFAYSAGFMRLGGAVLFGVCLAGSLLTKWSAWTYLLPLIPAVFRALRGRLSRWNTVLALLIALGLPAPWYWAHAPVILPRLIDASADQGIPFWSRWAFLSYFWILLQGLDAPLCLLGLIALFVPSLKRGREGDWIVPLWFVTSLVFWTLVPNRQMRFLFPAVAPLALLASSAFPRWLTAALCAWQLFSAANYSFAWVKPFSIAVGRPITFLSVDPPVKESWPTETILREAERRRDPTAPFSNLTLLANHERFNGPTFNWVRKQAGVEGIRIRGVNRRVCELSEFMVVKTGSLGPASVVNQLPYVRDEILQPGSWFLKGYDLAARWPLPDGTEALLYQRRRRRPFAEKRIREDFIQTGQYAARNLSLRLGDWDARRSAYARAELDADALVIRGLEIRNVHAVLEGLDFIPLMTGGRIEDVRLLRLDRLTLQWSEVTAEGVAAFLAARVPSLAEPSVRLEKTIRATGRLAKRIAVAAEAAPELEPSGLSVRLTHVTLGPVSFAPPTRFATFKVPFTPNPETPFEIRLAGLTIKNARLTIP